VTQATAELPPPQRTVLAMRGVFALGAALVFTIGADLFVFSDRTDELSAWTVVSPVTAAFLGTFYLTACVLAVLSFRQRLWSNARVGLLGVFVFVSVTLWLTVLHRSQLHFDAPTPFARLVAYTWVVVYAVDPLLIAGAWLLQRRAHGNDALRLTRLPRWYRGALALAAAALLGLGLALLVPIQAATEAWPWPIDDLDVRAMGAWVVGLSLVVGQAAIEDAWERIKIALISATALGLLQLVLLARFHASFEGRGATGAYLVAVLSVLVIGAYGTFAASRATR
jgi:hypothetical protein